MALCRLNTLDSSLPHPDLLRLGLNQRVIGQKLNGLIDLALGEIKILLHEAESLSQAVADSGQLLVARSPTCTEKCSNTFGTVTGSLQYSRQRPHEKSEVVGLVLVLGTHKVAPGLTDLDLQGKSPHSLEGALRLTALDLEGQLADTVREDHPAGLFETWPSSAFGRLEESEARITPNLRGRLLVSVAESLVPELFLVEEIF